MKRIGIAILATALLGAPAAAQDDEGGLIERSLEDLLSGDGRDVVVTGFEGALSSTATLDEMTVADSEGVWLTIRDAELSWSRLALLRGRVEVEHLRAEEIIVERAPVSEEAAAPSPEASGFSLPDLPVSINIGEVATGRLALGESLFGEAAELTLEGNLRLADGAGEGSFEARRIDGREGVFDIQGSFDNATEVLSVSVAVEEEEDGIIATLANLPGRPALSLQAGGEGPLSDFDADLALATAGEERLRGTLSIDGTSDEDTEFSADLSGDISPLVLPEFQEFFGPDVALTVAGNIAADGVLTLSELELTAAQVALGGQVVIGADGLPRLIDLSGEIASGDGEAVVLPAGEETRVDRVDLAVSFDSEAGERWTADLLVAGLRQGGITAQRIALDGSGTIASGPSRRVTADIDVVAEALDLGDPDVQAAIGERVTGAASIEWQDGDPVEVPRLRVTGETYALDGTARIETAEGGVDVSGRFTSEAADLSAFSGIAGRPLAGSVEATLSGEVSPIAGLIDVALSGTGRNLEIGVAEVDGLLGGLADLDIALRRDETGTYLNRFSVRTEAVEARASARVVSGGGVVSTTIRLADPSPLVEDLDGPFRILLNGEGAGNVWDVSADVIGEGLSLAADLEADLSAEVPRVSGAAYAGVARLDVFADRLGRPVAGAAEVTAEGFVTADLRAFSLDITAEAERLVTGIGQVDALVGESADLVMQATRSGDRITFDRVEAQSSALWFSGAGEIGLDGSADVAATGRLIEPGRLAPGLPGPIDFRADIAGGGESWDIVAGAEGPGTGLTADVAVDLGGTAPRVSGEARIDVRDLAPLSELAGRVLGGAVDLRVGGSALADLSTFDISLAGTTQDLVTGVDRADALLRGRTVIDASVQREGGTITAERVEVDGEVLQVSADGTVSVERAGRARAEITLLEPGQLLPGLSEPLSLTASASGGPDLWEVTAAVDGADLGGGAEVTVDLSGEVPAGEGAVRIAIGDLAPFSALAGRSLGGSVELDAEGSLAGDLGEFDLVIDGGGQNVRIGIPAVDGLLRGNLDLSAEAIRTDGLLRVQDFSLQTPQLSASGRGSMGAETNEAIFDMRLANLGQFVPGLPGPATARGRASQTDGGDWQIDVSADGPGGITVQVDGSAAAAFDRLNLSASGALPLAAADPFIAPRAVNGTARFDLSVNGPPALSSVSGTITTAGARAVAPTVGIVLNDVATTVRLSGGTATLDVGAAVEAGGRVGVSGTIGLSGALPASLSVRLENAALVDPGLYETRVSGTIRIDGPLAGGAAIGGTLALGNTEVRIPSTGLSGTGTIPENLVHENEPATVRATRRRAGLIQDAEAAGAAGSRGPAYGLDLTVNAPNQIFVRGRGLDAELGGSIRIVGTTAQPIPTGRFELIRGRLDILGKRLRLVEGTATLQGEFDPAVRLVARTEAAETQISIIVDGPVSEPEILFVSDPDLPQDEIVARLLFGRGIDNLSPLQAARLASAVATLAGRGGGLLNEIRSGFGLDDLDVTTDDDGNIGVRAGAYISENVYTDVTVDAEGAAEVSINLDLTPSVTVRSKLGSEGQTGVGVFFERDY